jgi:hypothetical protein
MSEPAAVTAPKPRHWQPSRQFKIAMAAIMVPVLIFGMVLLGFRITNTFERRKLENAFNSISLPSEFKRTGQSWVAADFGSASGWNYEYTVDASQQTALALLQDSLQKAGFESERADGSDSNLVSENKQRGVRVHIQARSIASRQPGSKAADQAQLPPQKLTLFVEDM